MRRIKKIGKVDFFYNDSDPNIKEERYFDNSEDQLLTIFEKPESEQEKTLYEFLKQSDLSWALRYHLSPMRQKILDWYPFDRNKDLLEIGAGCGALTGLFLSQVRHVTSNELEFKRASVIAHRYADRENLTVSVMNILDQPPEKLYFDRPGICKE